jgi:hypothetical protein
MRLMHIGPEIADHASNMRGTRFMVMTLASTTGPSMSDYTKLEGEQLP